MSSLAALAHRYTALDEAGLAHIRRLVQSWGVLSDLSFSDLLVFAPLVEDDDLADDPAQFIVMGQIRPATSQTLHRDDLVGQVVDKEERPLVSRCWKLAEIIEGDVSVTERGELARIQCIPIRLMSQVIAVLARESPALVTRRPGELENTYLSTYDRFARMIVEGSFPYDIDENEEGLPRVGDGAMLLDEHQRIVYQSPNAVNALHRMGVHTNTDGMRLDEVGVEASAVRAAFSAARPVTEEIERRNDIVVFLRVLPLISRGAVDGALVLSRDVTDIRRRDRLLLSKDATIREVHHRVKNNLQTISSLLRLQARRLSKGEGRTSLEEAERRIRSIALVHEILSRDPGQQVPFEAILKPLVQMAEDVARGENQTAIFTIDGEAGELQPQAATPLAVVLLELLVNAAEHAFASNRQGTQVEVSVSLRTEDDYLVVQVRDNGIGFPDDFSIATSNSLGLSIVQGLVETQLNGQMNIANDGGAIVTLRIPIDHSSTFRH